MHKNENQQFNNWIKVKKKVHFKNKIPQIAEGEVWWCSMGKNVGIEINGKSETFSRPAIIFKKLSRLGFLAIPLSTQPHRGDWYVPFKFRGKDEIAVLSQIKIMSVARLYTRLGQIDETDFEKVQQGFAKLYLGKKCT